MEFLDKFIIQAHSGDLKTKHYKELFNGYDFIEKMQLNIKVSFGQMKAARIPWISFVDTGMVTSNGYYPVYLYYKNENILILSLGISEQNKYESEEENRNSWSDEITKDLTLIDKFIDNPPRYGNSFVYESYNVEINQDKVIYSQEKKPIRKSKLQNDLEEIIEVYEKELSNEEYEHKNEANKNFFHFEKQLEDFIVENWDKTPFSKNYDLIYDEDGHSASQQYRTDIGNIDILAMDKKKKNHVVIELKRGQGSDDTVGQISRYMGWIKEKTGDDKVEGIIVVGSYDKRLDYALKPHKNIKCFIYEIEFDIHEHSSNI